MSLAIILFVCTYLLIISGIIPRTVAAFAGAAAMLALGLIKPIDALKAIDFDTVGLLTGMMIIVGITRKTGVFEYLAVKAAKGAKGEPAKILSSLCMITAVLSAFLDNVTTVMLILPVAFALARQLEISPVPFLMSIIISSNIGGTATLVGDPPNIMISGFTGLGFMDFVINLAPPVTVIYIITVFLLVYKFKRELQSKPKLKEKLMSINEKALLMDRKLLYKSLAVVLVTILGFVFHQFLKLEPAFIAVVAAGFLIIITKNGVINSLKNVEWSVIIFFISLFILVGTLDKTGVIDKMAKAFLGVTGGNILPTALIILWFSAIASAFVDNIPMVAAMIPLILDMGNLGGISDLNFLWWSLSLGACLGGNGTPVGASANVVVIGMAEKRGVHISFLGYMAIAFPLMVLSIVVSTGYLIILYVFK